MVLKEEEGPDVAAAMRALRAEQEREEKINEAVGMADEGRFMAAVEALTGDDPVRAAQLVWQWEEQAAQAIYEEARQAYEDGRLDEAEEALARLEEMRKPFEQARDLRRSIAAQRSGADRRDDYGELINTLEAAIKAGNFPVAQQALTQLQEYTAGNYEPAGDQPLPDEAVQEGNRNLDEARSEFDLEVRILRAHLERNRCDRAREKLNEIKKQFPEHPDIETLEEAVVECEEGAE
jgi:tetratricopeptide (TPR) repeat protein